MTKNEKRVPTSKSALHRVAVAERMKERQMQVKTVCDGVHFAFFGMFPRLPADLRGVNGQKPNIRRGGWDVKEF